MAVRDHLKQIGRKPLHRSIGESVECSIVYGNGIPQGYVSKVDKSTVHIVTREERAIAITRDSSRQVRAGLRCCYPDEVADCSAGDHPASAARISEGRDFFAGKTDALIDTWTEMQSRINRAQETLLMAIQDTHYTNPQKYASQFAHL